MFLDFIFTFISLPPLLPLLSYLRLDCALYLAIQQERFKAIAMLMLCKATITGDCQAIRSLISEPPSNSGCINWYMPEVHTLLSQGTVKMYCPIAVSIMVKNYDATKELLLCTDLDMRRKQVDWSRLKLTLLHHSWVYSIAPWVVNLKLGNNNLRKLPGEFVHATQLRRLDLSSNLLEVIDIDLFSLPNLEGLNLSQNKLRELSEDTKWSQSLTNLDLSSNCLTTLPSSIQHSSLEILQLSGNKFTSVPKSLCRVRSLTTLDLSSMPISSLPKEIDMLDKLANLNVTDCNISDLPAGALPGRGWVRGFVRSRSRSSKPCNIVKLLILSNSSVGKVVLFSRLRQVLCPPGSHLPEMDFFQWNYRPFKFFGIQKLIFNTWMVGVQREYRLLYPSLYTANALYILVWDLTKTGDIQNIKVYVNSISRRFPMANVLVIAILPEPYETWAESNIAQLNKKVVSLFTQPSYRSLRFQGLLALSSSPSPRESTVDIRLKVYEIASQMTVNGSQVTGRQFPENYYHLLPVIEREHTNLKTGGRPGIMEENTLWSMLSSTIKNDMPDSMELPVIISFLKESGYLMHFDDPNSRLSQYHFLHPEWLVATITGLLNNLHYHHAHWPIVTTEKLTNLLKLGGESGPTSAVVRLLIRFHIVLPISDSAYLIPSILPHNPPPLAMIQIGCYRRQLIPKGRSIPEDFWYYLISHLLFHLPRLLGSQDPIIHNLFRVTREDPHRSMKTPEQKKPYPDAGKEETNLTSSPAEDERMVVSEASHAKGKISKKQRSFTDSDDVELQLHPASEGSGEERRLSNDPIKICQGIVVWRTGIQLVTGSGVKLTVHSQSSDLGLDEAGVEVCCNEGEDGIRLMAKVCWLIQKLFEQRYPEFSPKIQASSLNGITQIILCPRCMGVAIQGGGATNFIIETCFVSLKDQESFSHNCHHHSDPIPLRELIPDYLLVDLPDSLSLKKDSFVYQDTRSVYRDNSTVLCDGWFGGKPVTVKKHLFSESKSYCVPLSALRQELEMLSLLSHPNIIKTYGYCFSPPCLLLERSPLGTLLQKLSDNEQRISRLVRFHIGAQVSSALAYLHKHSIIYRTLKSDSVLTWSLEFEDEVSVKLAHFDRAAFSTPTGLLSKTDFSFYPAPEMVRYEFSEEYTEKVDVYSFGILLYELVARWQPFASDKTTMTHKPKLTGLSTYGFGSLVKLMEECWEEDPTLRPSADSLLRLLSEPQFQCHLSTQTLRDCVSVRGCCYVPSLSQVWAYGEYNVNVGRDAGEGNELLVEGTQVFILNASNLTVQGSLELRERANAICTVDSKVWVGMLEACIHIYDSTSFNFTDRVFVKDSVTDIATNDKYAFVGLANGTLTYYDKLKFPSESDDIKIGDKALISMLSVGECLWVVCGNEIIVLCIDDDDITVARRLTASASNHQAYALVLSQQNSLVWCFIKSSLVLLCWDASSCIQAGSFDLSETLSDICTQTGLDSNNLRLLSLECCQDIIWVGVSVGVVILLTATPNPRVITWFRAHRSSTRCLITVPDTGTDNLQVVLSGGFGEHSYIKTPASHDNGVIMSWQGMSSSELETLARRWEERKGGKGAAENKS